MTLVTILGGKGKKGGSGGSSLSAGAYSTLTGGGAGGVLGASMPEAMITPPAGGAEGLSYTGSHPLKMTGGRRSLYRRMSRRRHRGSVRRVGSSYPKTHRRRHHHHNKSCRHNKPWSIRSLFKR